MSAVRRNEAPVDGVVGLDQGIGTGIRELVCGGEHELTQPLPVAAVDAFHVLRKRVRTHRDLGMGVRTENLRAFHADRPITRAAPSA